MTEATAKHYDTIVSPVITEKATIGAESNQYVFKVLLKASKPEIAEAVEALFDVKVKAVNTLINKGKSKRFRGRPYTRSDVKKAMVTLEDGHSIDVTTGL
jgi:large subunit ribosomal protein L23